MLGQELEHGVFETDAPENHCMVIHRTITDLQRHLHDAESVKFTDNSGDHRQDTKLNQLVQDLKEETFPQRVHFPIHFNSSSIPRTGVWSGSYGTIPASVSADDTFFNDRDNIKK